MSEKESQNNDIRYVYSPHNPITLPLTIMPHTQIIYKSLPIQQPFIYEVYCPLSCMGIMIGAYNSQPCQRPLQGYQFRTTTNRIVQVSVNNDIVCTVNGNKPQNKQKRKVDNQNSWGIGIRVKDKGNFAILNPYAVNSNPLSVYTLKPLPETNLRPVQLQSQEKIQISRNSFKVQQKNIFYESGKINYQPNFSNPTNSESLITIDDPLKQGYAYHYSLGQLKEFINNELSYFLKQLDLTIKVSKSKEVLSQLPKENLDDIYQNIDRLLKLDESIRCRLLYLEAKQIYHKYYSNHSRLYTAIYRLSSFLNYGNTRFDVVKLAEAGFYNKSDILQDLGHYENPYVPIPNIEEGDISLTERQIAKKYIPFLRSLNDQTYPNVPLSISLNNMPCQIHKGSQNFINISKNKHYFGILCDKKKFSLWTSQVLLLNFITIDITKIQKKEEVKLNLLLQNEKEETTGIGKCESIGELFGEVQNKKKEKEEPTILPDNDLLEQLIKMGFPVPLCKKALIITKNQSIQVVLDMIEELRIEQDKKNKILKETSKIKIKNEWFCSACTLKNIAPNETCQICSTPAPQDAFINQEQQKRKEQERKQKEEIQKQREKQEEQRKLRFEEEQRKRKLEEESIRMLKQEDQKLESFILNAEVKDVKIIYNQDSPLDPFFIVFLLRNNQKTLLRVFRIGLNRSYIHKFYRIEGENLISNFNQSIRKNNFDGLSQIIREARRSVEWGRKLFQQVHDDWVLQESKDLFLEEQYKCLEVRDLKLKLIGGKNLSVTIQIKDQMKSSYFQLKIQEREAEFQNIVEPIEQEKVVPVRQITQKNELTLAPGTCYVQIQILEHFNSNKFPFIKSIADPSQVNSVAINQKSIMSNYIPLQLQQYQGSCCNQKHIPSSILQPGQNYVSNYGLTHFIFKSIDDKNLLIENVTVISENKTLNGGYPIGSGLIFTADEIGWFNISKQQFINMKKLDYDTWLSKKRRGQQINYWEPVGAFQLKDNDKSIEFELNCKRPAKYIFLLPTSVRKSTCKFQQASIVIDFFGVKGKFVDRNTSNLNIANQIQKQIQRGNFVKVLNAETGEQFQSNQLIIQQKTQYNGFSFINSPLEENLKITPVSLTTNYFLRINNINNNAVKLLFQSENLKWVKTHSTKIHSLANTISFEHEKAISNILETLYTNPFCINEIINKIDLYEFIKSHVLIEIQRLHEVQTLILNLQKEPEFKRKLLDVLLILLKELNEPNLKVSPEGLKTFFALLSNTYIVDKEKTAKTIIEVWQRTSEYVKKIRNPMYRILRNKYTIPELILEKRLFSEYYHHLMQTKIISNPIQQTQKKQEIVKPAESQINYYSNHSIRTHNYQLFIDLINLKDVSSIDFYVQKLKNTSKFKLRVKIYAAEEQNGVFRKALVYHNYYHQQLIYSLGNYAYTVNSQIYKNKPNKFTIQNLNFTTRYVIVEFDFSLLTASATKKYKDSIENILITPIINGKKAENVNRSTNLNWVQTNEKFKPTINQKLLTIDEERLEGLPVTRSEPIDGSSKNYVVYTPIQTLKDEVIGANEHVNQIVSNIMNQQIVKSKYALISFKGYYGEKGLDFCYTYLIMIIKFTKSSLMDFITKQNITNTLLQIYEVFVLYEIGPIHETVLSLIIDCIQKINGLQSNRFVNQLVLSYLSDAQKLKKLSLSEEYQIKHVLNTLKKIKSLPIGQLIHLIKQNSSKLQLTNILLLIKDSLKKKQPLELNIYDLESNVLIKKLELKEVLDRIFDICLLLLANLTNNSGFQNNLLSLALQVVLQFFQNIQKLNSQQLKIIIDNFLNKYTHEQLWRLIFITLKLKDEQLQYKINTLLKHLIANSNETFNKNINKMIYQIINKSENSLYMQINKEVSDQIWMRHLQTVLEFLIKSQKQTTVFLDLETAQSLLTLPLTTLLWSLALHIIPRDERILQPLIKNLTPQLYSILSNEIMAFCQPLAQLKPIKFHQLNWLQLVKKRKLEGKTLFQLFVQELSKSNYGGRQALTMAKQSIVSQMQTTDQLLQLVLEEKTPFSKKPQQSTIGDMIQWYFLNRSIENGQSPATQILKSISQNLLKLFSRFHEQQELVRMGLEQLLRIKKDTEIIETLCREKILNNYTSLNLNQRICECFEQLIEIWMKNDNLAHFFAFNIKGFDYIFNLIGIDQQVDLTAKVPIYQPSEQDLYIQSLDLISTEKKKIEEKQDNNIIGISDFKQQELGNKVKLIKLPGQQINPTTEDWTVNKKGAKNKIFFAHMVAPFYNEYPIIVELDKIAQIKSIKIGFMASDFSFGDKIAGVPSAILVEGGLDIQHLEPLGELVLLNDEGYTNASIKVFVKNFQMLKSYKNIEQSIKSLSGSKIKILKFIIRRPIISFIEGLSVLNGKIYKSLGFSLSFLSISGYDTNKLPINLEKRCKQMSKRTSLVVLSKLFNESFISTINKLANEPVFVTRIKNNFKEISTLMDQYIELVSSINYILGANNQQLGDWMIQYFLKYGSKQTHAKLISQILLSNARKIYIRLKMVLESILKKIQQIRALGNQPENINKFNDLVPFLENFCTSLNASISSISSNKLQLLCTKNDIDNILELYDTNYLISSSTTLIKLLVSLNYMRLPYCLSQNLLEYTLDRIWQRCSENKLHFYDLLSAMVLNKGSVKWLQLQNNKKVSELINQTYKAIQQNKLKLVKVQIHLITQISFHLHKHLLNMNCHIELYNRLKGINFTTGQILNSLVKIIKNTILNNPGSEIAISQMLIRDLEILSKKKDALLQKFYVDILGIEKEVNIAIKGLGTIPKQDFTIPSTLLNKTQQIELMKKISTKVKFSLSLVSSTDSDNSLKSQIISHVQNPPYLIIVKMTDGNKSCICGVYCVTEPEHDEGEVWFPGNPSNFLFYLTEQKSVFLDGDVNERLGFYPTEDEFSLVFNYGGNQKIKLSFDQNNQSYINFDQDTTNYSFSCCEFWELKQLQNSNTLALSLGTQAYAPLSYYRPEPVYIVPHHINIDKLLKMLGVNTKIFVKGKEIEKDRIIGTFEDTTEDFIIDMQVNLSNCTTFTPDKGYIPQMIVYKEFEKQSGVNKLIQIGGQSIKGWKNPDRKKKWQHFMEEVQIFIHLPNFFGLFIKNIECFNLLFEVVAGLPDDVSNTSKNWEQEQAKATRFIYQILADIFKLDKSAQIRSLEINDGFCQTVLDKLAFISKETVRRYQQPVEGEQGEVNLQNNIELRAKKSVKEQDRKKKKKGIGYGADNNPTSKWSTSDYIEHRKKMSEQILRIVTIIVNFLDGPEPARDDRLSKIFKQSCLLPLLESSLRSGSILDISKQSTLFQHYLQLIRTLAKNPNTIDCLLSLGKGYKPEQTQSIYSLLQKLNKTAEIFLSCLKTTTNDVSNKVAEEIGHNIKNTFEFVQTQIQKMNKQPEKTPIRELLKLPLAEAYRKLLGPLRFDYVNMKQNNAYKHHWSSLITEATPPPSKVLRLSQQLADLSSSLPCEHTNSIFVRCDKERVDIIRALIMGSKDTPYSNGAFLFDVFCEDLYPNGPPKMAITTTGSGKIRFNPNLYSCGKVCLSLLGTWRGLASQNWDAKLSTLLQLFISTQGITMSQDIYFNEPGFEGEQGTDQGEKKNEAYANIVRLGNVRYAMVDQIKNPPKGFETIIHRHFYLKKNEIMQQCRKWIKFAQTREASYVGLVNDHNNSWCSELKQSKTKYKELLTAAVDQLQKELNKLQQPKLTEQVREIKIKKHVKAQQTIGQKLEEIDVTYQKSSNIQQKEMNYLDEKVKDRWSRYIGAMGLQAVKKQAESEVLLIGLGTLGLQIAKNIILSGVKRITIVDNQIEKSSSQHFYLTDLKKQNRSKCLFKLQELNHYVRVDHSESIPNLSTYNIIADTRRFSEQTIRLGQECRKLNKLFISTESKGVYGRVFNDFGQKFLINDHNGEQPVEIMIKSISNQQNGVVKLLEGTKHPFEDGQFVVIELVVGMKQKQLLIEQKSEEQIFYEKMSNKKIDGINGRVFKIKVINSNSFQIGNTTNFEPYIRNGIARNLKIPKAVNFISAEESFKDYKKLPFDNNLEVYDFEKISDNTNIQLAFDTLGIFVNKFKRQPRNWIVQDAKEFIKLSQEKIKYLTDKEQEQKSIEKFLFEFSLVAESQLPVINAYLGGLVSQEIIKGITNKFTPIKQLFTFHFKELLPSIPETEIQKLHISQEQEFFNAKVILSKEITTKIEKSNVFIVGAGAIGCQLLKNFAMINLSAQGTLTVTDPDHIETSNLNRQFLFREKHLRKPKSSTAAAALLQMNPKLKGHVVAKLDKVCENTEGIYSDKFFKTLTLVTNALDNVQARLYVDRRCVANKVPLLESGTLGPKGHVQVIFPFVTESYGSQNDPTQQNQIPHCTLKLFPQDTLHCIEWSRDLFGKNFTLRPKGLKKLIDQSNQGVKLTGEQGTKEAVKLAAKAPNNFDECIYYAVKKFYKYFRNDIRQLLYTYPLDAKTKDGQPFWKLPKRPPAEISEIDPKDELHILFISSYAVNRAKIFSIPYPKNFRTLEGRQAILQIALKVKVPDFKPSEDKSKKISKLNEQKQNKQEQDQQIIEEKNYELSKEARALKICPEQFEKDDDDNGHIDLIYSMANLRSKNYSLNPYTWIQTKLKAGKIMPALSTTTSLISALQTIQLIKVIKNSKFYRNAFVNLAVPIVQITEPGPALKSKIGNTQISIWDEWEFKSSTLKDLLHQLQTKYEVEAVDVLVGGVPVYLNVMYKDKPKEREEILNKNLRQLLSLQLQDESIDFTILFKDKATNKTIEKSPTVRVFIP